MFTSGKSNVLVVNAARYDFDRNLDFSKLSEIANVTRFDDSTNEELLVRVQGMDVVITKEIPVPAEVILQFPSSVKIICEAGTGYNNISLAACKEKGITVCNVPAYSASAVAQLVITYIMNFSSSLIKQQRMLWAGDHSNFVDALKPPHFELEGKVLGLIGGGGSIGSKVAEVARALGMVVLIHSRNPKPQSGVEIASSLQDLLIRSDFVSIHCPLIDATKYMIDKTAFSTMKKSAFIINTARGAIIKETDLIEALQSGEIAGAGIDVQETEPPDASSPLYTLENCILTPHIGWKRLETRQRLVDAVAKNVGAFISGNPINVVGTSSL
jgi:glycerate dehydrogenase